MGYNPYANIQQKTTLTKTPGELLVSLYDGCLLDLSKAKIAIENKDIAEANEMLMKSQKIVRYLNNTLNMQYPISEDLRKLYTYFDEQIIQSNLKKDASYIDTIYPMIEELRMTFAQADRISRQQAAGR
ncbi:MAG: flagellar export chaperone FliS [Erysipelotrichales bacterium]|nr:flagellar export chaperone FliS [Erysipelotrichales bacterium]